MNKNEINRIPISWKKKNSIEILFNCELINEAAVVRRNTVLPRISTVIRLHWVLSGFSQKVLYRLGVSKNAIHSAYFDFFIVFTLFRKSSQWTRYPGAKVHKPCMQTALGNNCSEIKNQNYREKLRCTKSVNLRSSHTWKGFGF